MKLLGYNMSAVNNMNLMELKVFRVQYNALNNLIANFLIIVKWLTKTIRIIQMPELSERRSRCLAAFKMATRTSLPRSPARERFPTRRSRDRPRPPPPCPHFVHISLTRATKITTFLSGIELLGCPQARTTGCDTRGLPIWDFQSSIFFLCLI